MMIIFRTVLLNVNRKQNPNAYCADTFSGSLMSDMDCSKNADLLAQLPRDR